MNKEDKPEVVSGKPLIAFGEGSMHGLLKLIMASRLGSCVHWGEAEGLSYGDVAIEVKRSHEEDGVLVVDEFGMKEQSYRAEDNGKLVDVVPSGELEDDIEYFKEVLARTLGVLTYVMPGGMGMEGREGEK